MCHIYLDVCLCLTVTAETQATPLESNFLRVSTGICRVMLGNSRQCSAISGPFLKAKAQQDFGKSETPPQLTIFDYIEWSS